MGEGRYGEREEISQEGRWIGGMSVYQEEPHTCKCNNKFDGNRYQCRGELGEGRDGEGEEISQEGRWMEGMSVFQEEPHSHTNVVMNLMATVINAEVSWGGRMVRGR